MIIDVNGILTPHGKECLLEEKGDKEEKTYNKYGKRRTRKKAWKSKIYAILDSIGTKGGDIFELNRASAQENSDEVEGKFKALETVLTQFVRVTAKLAAALLITRHKSYDPSKLLDAAKASPTNKTDVTGNMAQAIRDDIEEIDEKFKLNFKIDAKLNRIKRQTNKAEGFLQDLVPYIDWVKFSEWANKGDVRSVYDMQVIGGGNDKLFRDIKKYAEEIT
jgi:hypothetical protein